MALSHNALIRGFNSIYQTAPRLFPESETEGPKSAPAAKLTKSELADAQRDFVQYCLAWARLLDEHHRVEEEGIFPAVEKIVGEKGVMGREAEEHGWFSSFVSLHLSCYVFPIFTSKIECDFLRDRGICLLVFSSCRLFLVWAGFIIMVSFYLSFVSPNSILWNSHSLSK